MKKLKRLFCIMLFSVTVASAAVPSFVNAAPSTKVYITQTGKKYHLKNCRTTKRGKVTKLKLKNAKAKKFTACKVCVPSKK